MKVIFDGNKITSEREFHKEFARAFDLGPFYGKNLNAFWDVLSAGLGQIELVWENSEVFASIDPQKFEQIVGLFEEKRLMDIQYNFPYKFTYSLE
jgi:ribonuclease inhibitor